MTLPSSEYSSNLEPQSGAMALPPIAQVPAVWTFLGLIAGLGGGLFVAFAAPSALPLVDTWVKPIGEMWLRALQATIVPLVAALLFTGVAGGLAPGVNVGDVVVAEDFIQHDMDASPLAPRYEVPGSGRSRFACDAALSQLLAQAAQDALVQYWPQARVHRGLVASGDRFVCGLQESHQLQQCLRGAGHEALAVEMEGAAVAQVCADHGLPFAAMRTISDRADDEAHLDFKAFVETVASQYAHRILGGLLARLPSVH